jgi:hypothetical protein
VGRLVREGAPTCPHHSFKSQTFLFIMGRYKVQRGFYKQARVILVNLTHDISHFPLFAMNFPRNIMMVEPQSNSTMYVKKGWGYGECCDTIVCSTLRLRISFVRWVLCLFGVSLEGLVPPLSMAPHWSRKGKAPTHSTKVVVEGEVVAMDFHLALVHNPRSLCTTLRKM